MNTIKILTNHAVPGMKVAEDIYTEDNNLIISEGTSLTDSIITRLEFYSIEELLIRSNEETILAKAEADHVEQTYFTRIKSSESFQRFHKAYTNSISNLKDGLDDILSYDTDPDVDFLLSEVNKILRYSETNIDLFHMLHCIRHYDDTTYIHSLNVSLICNIMGRWLSFNEDEMNVITICGLLHDIGKLMIPSDIIKKPDILTDEEFKTVKGHPIEGYKLLRDSNLDDRIKKSILMHHERCDGSGYPYGLKSNEINSYAKLVSIADVYDAMTTARVYRGPMCPFDVINIFESEAFKKYDPKYVMTFMEGISNTYINTDVRLSNKQEGTVIFVNKMSLSKPVVRVKDEFIDLSKKKDLKIEAII